MPKTEQPKGGKLIVGTPKQELAAELLVENVRKKNPEPVGKVLQKAGYSKALSEQPSRIIETPNFQALLDKHLGDKMLLKKHKSLLNAATVIDSYVFSNSMTDEEIKKLIEEIPGCKFIRTQRNPQNCHAYFYKPDNGTQTKALELAYKIKKKMGGGFGDDDDGQSEEIREVIFRIKKILPEAGK